MTSHDVIAMSRLGGCLWRKRPQLHLLWSRFLSKTTKAIYCRKLRCQDFTFHTVFVRLSSFVNHSGNDSVEHIIMMTIRNDISYKKVSKLLPWYSSIYICLSKQYFRLVLTESIQLPKNLFWLNVQSSGHDLYVHAYIVIMYCKRFLSVIRSLSFLHSSSIQVVGRIDH